MIHYGEKKWLRRLYTILSRERLTSRRYTQLQQTKLRNCRKTQRICQPKPNYEVSLYYSPRKSLCKDFEVVSQSSDVYREENCEFYCRKLCFDPSKFQTLPDKMVSGTMTYFFTAMLDG